MNKNTPTSWLSDIESILEKAWLDTTLTWRILSDLQAWNNKRFLEQYQWALSLWAEHLQDTKQKIVVTLDGRDTAGKWSNIKRVADQLDNSAFWVTAFWGIPTSEERDKDNWFQKFESQFPEAGKMQFFDRSWYNRAWVEAAMGFCTEEEYNWFMNHVNDFEKNRIIWEWIDYLKVYLSIWKQTQKNRLKERENVRKRWKSSPVDAEAQEKWGYYTLAKEQILRHTDTEHAPWMILDSTERYLSAVEIIKALVWTRSEVTQLVENDLSIDLSPDWNIRRTAEQELSKMESEWQIPSGKKFKFRV